MATINAVFAGHGTLVATAVDTVNLTAQTQGAGKVSRVEVSNNTAVGGGGAATIYVGVGAAAPMVGGADTYAVQPGTSRTIPFAGTVKLISSSTPAYSVTAVTGS